MTDSGMELGYIPITSLRSGDLEQVRSDLHCLTVQIVNLVFIGEPGRPDGWVLVDAGMPQSADRIVEAAERLYGAGARPSAILLTHGHFDHVGAVVELAERWQVQVYTHAEELPYVTGREPYPEPDPSVEGGLLAKVSGLYPNEPVNLGSRVSPLPADGTVPGLPDWRWIHTPGHTPGHISLFRAGDGALIAGDAFVTVRQDSLYRVLLQQVEVNGPPRYYTLDWELARTSVKKLAALRPSVAITGHGAPMEGEALSLGLGRLAAEFDELARPDYGKYVDGEA